MGHRPHPLLELVVEAVQLRDRGMRAVVPRRNLWEAMEGGAMSMNAWENDGPHGPSSVLAAVEHAAHARA